MNIYSSTRSAPLYLNEFCDSDGHLTERYVQWLEQRQGHEGLTSCQDIVIRDHHETGKGRQGDLRDEGHMKVSYMKMHQIL